MNKWIRHLVVLSSFGIILSGCNENNDEPEEGVGEVEVDKSNSQTTEDQSHEEEEFNQDELSESDGGETEMDSIEISKENSTVYEIDMSSQSDLMYKADGWGNGDMFDNTWRADNIVFEDGLMKMRIDTDAEAGENDPEYSAGEYRSSNFYHYGLYEVSMKPIKNDGVVSSFFTYTGPSDNNPWDEIDIEFLGKDTTRVQFNYFTDGVGNNEYYYNLGYDASEEFHIYAFEWLPDSITWYVDGEEVHKATEDIPQTPAKVMMNVWPGIDVDGWLNPFDGTVPLTAEYEWIRMTQYEMIDNE